VIDNFNFHFSHFLLE